LVTDPAKTGNRTTLRGLARSVPFPEVALSTTLLVLILVLVAVAAVVSVPLMIRSTRRQVVWEPSPVIGSPAQVWVARGERVLREIDATLGEYGISADAAQVVAELRATARQVAELDHVLSRIPVSSLEDERVAISSALAEAAGRPAAADLSRSLDAVSARIAAAQRQRDGRAALLAKMQASVLEFEQARDELAELLAGGLDRNDSAAAKLTGRLDALREGLVEVRGLTDPETDRGGQG
jgi:hypothetical protein